MRAAQGRGMFVVLSIALLASASAPLALADDSHACSLVCPPPQVCSPVHGQDSFICTVVEDGCNPPCARNEQCKQVDGAYHKCFPVAAAATVVTPVTTATNSTSSAAIPVTASTGAVGASTASSSSGLSSGAKAGIAVGAIAAAALLAAALAFFVVKRRSATTTPDDGSSEMGSDTDLPKKAAVAETPGTISITVSAV